MSLYLVQETKPGKSANWIVKNYEQIDGDVLRTAKDNKTQIMHFACLTDEDIDAVKTREFSWPLNADFFEVAQNPVDWKYQVFVKARKEYKNFKRYALIYGLEFNKGKYKLSYVKRDGDLEREPYYLLKILGVDKKRNIDRIISRKLEDVSKIQFKNSSLGTYSLYDYYRYKICMLADEVGMGKTVEAISVYKIFSLNKSNAKALVVVPTTLKEQWKSELLLKFNIMEGYDANNNLLLVKSIDDISSEDLSKSWDFIIVDEVHKFLFSEGEYKKLHTLSENTKNLLLLSATPVQQKKEEYLDLLRLLLPQKYDKYSVDEFGELIGKQSRIIQKTALILDDLSDLEETIQDVEKDEEDPHESEDCIDLIEKIQSDLEEICEEIDDQKLTELLKKIVVDSDDMGVYAIKVVISYICGNYQIESNIIRNRRKILETNDLDDRMMASRDLVELTYDANTDRNVYEHLIYEDLAKWIMTGLEEGRLKVETDIKPLLSSFFSSSWAFEEHIKKCGFEEIDDKIENWIESEQYNIDHIVEILEDPDAYYECYASRLVVVLNALFDEYYDKKVVLFTNYEETFEAYKSALSKAFSEEEVSFFGANMSIEEVELNAYRFQSQEECRILLCDYTGGEGRNFQCADYIVHIDLPWDASLLLKRKAKITLIEKITDVLSLI